MKRQFILYFCSLSIVCISPVQAAPTVPDIIVSAASNELKADAIAEIIQGIKAGDLDNYRRIWQLQESEQIAIIPHLVTLLQDSEPQIRQRAAVVFHRLSWYDTALQERMVNAIQPLLTDSRRDIRFSAASALGYIRQDDRAKEVIAELLTLLKDTNPAVRSNAADILGVMENSAPSIAPELILLLQKDPTPQVRMSAAGSLGAIGLDIPKAYEILEQVSKNDLDPEVRKVAEDTLFHLYYRDHERIRGL
jgi:HEAT repeat protein